MAAPVGHSSHLLAETNTKNVRVWCLLVADMNNLHRSGSLTVRHRGHRPLVKWRDVYFHFKNPPGAYCFTLFSTLATVENILCATSDIFREERTFGCTPLLVNRRGRFSKVARPTHSAQTVLESCPPFLLPHSIEGF